MNDWFRGVDGRLRRGAGRGAGLQGAGRQGRAALHPDRGQRRACCPTCWICATPRGWTSSICRIWSMPGAATSTAARIPPTPAPASAMDLLIDRAWVAVAEDQPLEIVTGNNDADAVYFLRWVERELRRREGRACPRASGSLGRQFLGPRRRQHRPAGPGASRYLLVRLHRGLGQGARRSRRSGPAPTPMLATLRQRPRPLEGPLRRLRLSGGLRRQYPHPRAAGHAAIPGPRIRPAI